MLGSYQPIEADSGGGIYNERGEVLGGHWGYNGSRHDLGAVGRRFINIVTGAIEVTSSSSDELVKPWSALCTAVRKTVAANRLHW